MRYGVVKATFWTDPKVEGLSLHAKAIFLHFLTCPELTIVGLVNVSPGIMGYRLGMDTTSVLLAIKELEGIGAVKSDYENQVFWVVNFMKHNKPLGPKQIKGCVSCLKLYEFTTLSKDLSKTYRSSIQEVCKPQEQEQVHEQEHEQDPKPKKGDFVLSVPLKDGSAYGITQQQIDHYAELYPRVNIVDELRCLVGWNEASPAKRKTRKGIEKHITGWLGRKLAQLPPVPPSIAERAAAARAAEEKRKAEEKPTQDTATWVSTDQAIADGLIPPSQFALEHAQYERRMAKIKATSTGGTA